MRQVASEADEARRLAIRMLARLLVRHGPSSRCPPAADVADDTPSLPALPSRRAA
jgi:hypothetical protein